MGDGGAYLQSAPTLLRVAFFTEGGGTKGFGHIVRCKALAEEFCGRGFETLFFVCKSGSLPIFVGDVLDFEWDSLPQLQDIDIAVVDSYHAKKETMELISKNAKTTLFFDDFNRVVYPDGFVLNAAFGAANLAYSNQKAACLLGSKYVILRKEFRAKRAKKRVKTPRNILLSFGGADNKNAAKKISSILVKNHKKLEISVVKGKKPKRKREGQISYFSSLGAKKFRELMQKSNMGVFSCSQTLYEAFAVGLDSIGVLSESNQQSLCDGVENAVLLDDRFFWYRFENSLKKLRFGKQRRALDSGGAARTANILISSALEKSEIVFENILGCDKETQKALRTWRNEPFVREQMTTTHEISESEHEAWLKSIKENSSKKTFIAFVNGEPFGVCNLRLDGKSGEFGFYIFRKNLLGFGLGARMCEKFLSFAAKIGDIERVTSTVLKTNVKSFGLHKKLGFEVYAEDERNYYLKR